MRGPIFGVFQNVRVLRNFCFLHAHPTLGRFNDLRS